MLAEADRGTAQQRWYGRRPVVMPILAGAMVLSAFAVRVNGSASDPLNFDVLHLLNAPGSDRPSKIASHVNTDKAHGKLLMFVIDSGTAYFYTAS